MHSAAQLLLKTAAHAPVRITQIPTHSEYRKMKKKLNCWDVKKCGRQPGGDKVEELGVCPVAEETRADGIHGGENGGRCCWAIAGSLCKGERQGSYTEKFGDCHHCDFYETVRREEQPEFKIGITILKEIKKKGS